MKKSNSIRFVLVGGGVTLLSILFCSFVLYKIYNHELRQNFDIATLRGQIFKLESQIELLKNQS